MSLHPNAQSVVTPGLVAGNCLPLRGSVGFVDIQLRAAVEVKAVTLEHLPRVRGQGGRG